MKIYTVWGVRKDSDVPELMTAWDEYSIDSNPEGFREDVEKCKASWGNDLDTTRTLIFLVPDERITKAFEPVIMVV